jgi:hypothetical protein
MLAGMRRDTTEALADYESELRHELSDAGPVVLDVLRKAQLEVSRIERGEGVRGFAPWLLQVRPAEHITQAFELSTEVLVLFAPGSEMLARDIEQAEAAIVKGLRLDRSVVVVVTGDRSAPVRLKHVVSATHRQYVFVTIDEIRSVVDPQQWFRRFLREQLGAADLFASGPPVVGWDFFGRTAELDRLRQHLVAGRPVGLYGLRKIGKTSLALKELARLADETRSAKTAGGIGEATLSFHIDMQALALESNLAGFMRRLVKALFEGLDRVGISPKDLGLDPSSAKPATLRRYPDPQIKQLGRDTLESAIDWARQGSGRRVVAFIDEYERFFEPEVFPLSDALTILDYLRGLVQANIGSFNFIIAGLTRRHASESMIGRRQNPLFNFVVDFPLAGLTHVELQTLFRKIGRRLGLEFDAGAVDEVWKQTGGHPALARDYGRIIDRHVDRVARIDGARVDRALVKERYPTYARQVEMTMQDISRAVMELDPQGPFVLSEVATGPGPSSSLSPLSDDTVEQLRRLGILVHEQGWRVAIGGFAAWLVDNYPSSRVTGLVG